MSNPAEQHGNGGGANEFLARVYEHLPVLVVRLTIDGMVLGINPQVTRVTGYEPMELVGRNWWGTMFPGKLFAQVPKFITPGQADCPPPLRPEHPMVLQAKDGTERTVAWTRFSWSSPLGWKEVVCLGQDLTDRLTDADRAATTAGLAGKGAAVPTAPGEEIEGGFVQPLAVSPAAKTTAEGSARIIGRVQDCLQQVEERMAAVHRTWAVGGILDADALAKAKELSDEVAAMCRKSQGEG